MKRLIIIASVVLFISCGNDINECVIGQEVENNAQRIEITKNCLVSAAGALYDESSDSFGCGTIIDLME